VSLGEEIFPLIVMVIVYGKLMLNGSREISTDIFIRCFPHVVNLAVQAILLELDANPCIPVLTASSDPADQPALQAYARALKNDPIGECRKIVSACRSSGQRRRRLQAVISEGNENGYWRGKLPDGKTALPMVQLLRDCPTRWSSTFKMADRVLTLNPVHIRTNIRDRIANS
jgi:hypothetical protein